jgi:ankyrin repeat protein
MPKSIPVQALYSACMDGDTAAVSRLLPLATPRNLSGPHFQHPVTKNTPLIAAAVRGYTEIVRLILERAPITPVDHARANDTTALCMAADFHHVDTLQLLADRGADVNVKGLCGLTPLPLAVGQNHPNGRPRDPDPDGARQLATARALLRLGTGTLPPRAAPTHWAG